MSLFGKIKDTAKGLIGAATGLGGSKAAGNASKAQQEALRQAIATLQQTYTDQAGLLGGQQTIGNNALAQYAGLLGVGTGAGGNQAAPDYSSFFQSPGYQFQQQQGEQGINRLQAARGNLFSGNAAKELSRFNTGLANQSYQDYANRLGNFANLGPQTNQLLASYAGQRGQGIANAQMGIGDARAGGYVNQANAYNQGLNNLLGIGGAIFGAPKLPSGGTGGGPMNFTGF